MPWNNNGGPQGSGPWGGGGRGSGGGGRGQGPRNPWGGGNRPNGGGGGGSGGGGGQGPNIDDFFRRGQDQLKNVLGQGGGGGGAGVLLLLLLLAGAWVYGSVYIVREGERAVVLTFGEYTRTAAPGPTFAPWPVQTAEIENVEQQRTIEIGTEQATGGGVQTAARRRIAARDEGLMLTGDENIVDINFSVVWNIRDLQNYLFNLALPEATIRAVAESAIREIVGQSELQPLLNVGRGQLQQSVQQRIQATLDEYQSGVQVLRVNLDRVDPPETVREAFLDVQAAEQERDRVQSEAQATFNRVTAEARGQAQQILEEAEAYRARVVAGAQGEAARFVSILTEYQNATEVTRQRLYLETMERVLGGMNKIILQEQGGGSGEGVIQYLPLDQLNRGRTGGSTGGGQTNLFGGQGSLGGASTQ